MKNKGFTLIEALVSLTIFIAISTTLAQVIVISLQNQVKITATQEMFNESVFALDKIEKELRMAKKDLSGSCIDAEKNYKVSENSITFLSYDQLNKGNYRCKQIILEEGRIKEKVSEDSTSGLLGEAKSMTSENINIENLKFNVSGDGSDDKQPKITITMKISSKKFESEDSILLQTTISQRRLDL